MNLPEMPEPMAKVHVPSMGGMVPVGYTTDQMRSFFELGYKMGREDAAKVADTAAALSRQVASETFGDYPALMASSADTCAMVAAAIRGEPNGQDH
jgi:hypothetical protein